MNVKKNSPEYRTSCHGYKRYKLHKTRLSNTVHLPSFV